MTKVVDGCQTCMMGLRLVQSGGVDTNGLLKVVNADDWTQTITLLGAHRAHQVRSAWSRFRFGLGNGCFGL